MKSPNEFIEFLQATVAQQLPHVQPSGIREWITARLIIPYEAELSIDPDGTQLQKFWIITDHMDDPHYRVAYDPESGNFGIAVPLASGIEWYMGDYGTFKEAVEGM